MASICPRCTNPEAIAVLENADGIHLFPCLFCDVIPRRGATEYPHAVSAPCDAQHCDGHVEDHYEFGPERTAPVAISRRPCRGCGSTGTRKTKEPRRVPGSRTHRARPPAVAAHERGR
ncbi:hypothetical protein [Streptomyces varsoviensis]|uniref:hypothetical protein n=1 Tax=Streptomyces varsoviensis TaxID=67373 RepID=UPI0004C4F42C|nr:hypothetical protein [Streptomyces varsoviensis]